MRKRTGTIDITASGKFRLRVTKPDGSRETIGIFETREAADEMRSEVVDVLETEAPTTYGVTLGVYGDKFLTRREVHAEVANPDDDWSKWNTHVKDAPIAKFAMRSVKRSHVQELVRGVRKGRKRQTAQNVLNLLRVIFADALDAEVIKSNPCNGITLPKQRRTEEDWTHAIPGEQTALVDAAKFPHGCIVGVAIGTGIRAGELVALRLADVHHDATEPHIVVRYGGAPKKPTKGGRIRRVPLFGIGLAAMRAWLAALPMYAKKNPHGLAFPGPNGGFRSEEHVLRWDEWQAIKRAAGITRRFRWHDLRHTCGTSLVSGWWGPKWSLEEVKGMLGHASIMTTERYAHLTDSVLRDAAKSMVSQSATNWPSLAQGSDIIDTDLSVHRIPKPKVGSPILPEGTERNHSGKMTVAPNGRDLFVADSIAPPADAVVDARQQFAAMAMAARDVWGTDEARDYIASLYGEAREPEPPDPDSGVCLYPATALPALRRRIFAGDAA